tara:strand:- start:181 stop:678 length:498 start_codon:yes stop_codon:yes gene_type:complete
MADGGASSFIFLATALLISGTVSAVLISQYGDLASNMEQQRKGDEANAKTSFEFAGDISNIAYNTSGIDETITFYLQNTGEYLLDITTVFVQLDGAAISDTDLTTTVLPNIGDWGTDDLLQVQLQGNWGYADDTDINLTVLVQSVSTFGQTGTDSKSTEARLNEL